MLLVEAAGSGRTLLLVMPAQIIPCTGEPLQPALIATAFSHPPPLPPLQEDETPVPADALPGYQLVFDAVYTPLHTRLLR